MALDIEDYAPKLDSAAAAREREKIFQLKNLQHDGQRMREMTLNENWARYISHIEALIAMSNRSMEISKAVLTGPKFLTAEQYGQARLDLERHRAKKEAYTFVVNLVNILISKGDNAAEELIKENTAP